MEGEPAAQSLSGLFRAWLAIGLQSFGGGSATLALIHRGLVEQRRWVSDEEFTRDWALCQIAPGINLIAFAARLGGRLGGRCGSAAAGVVLSIVGMVLPSAAITIAITWGYSRVSTDAHTQAALAGLIPATVGVGLWTAFKMAVPLVRTSRCEGWVSVALTIALLAAAGGCVLLAHLPVLAVLLAGGVLGAAFQKARARRAA